MLSSSTRVERKLRWRDKKSTDVHAHAHAHEHEHEHECRRAEAQLEDAANATIAEREADAPHVLAQSRGRPLRDRDADLLGGAARFALYARRVGLGERARGRPDRGASASAASMLLASRNRLRHRPTVRASAPSALPVSRTLTPSAISSAASARRTIRFSAVAGRIAASSFSRSATDSGSGIPRGPGCGRFTHSSGSTMPATMTGSEPN
jgi:hypothetical protein